MSIFKKGCFARAPLLRYIKKWLLEEVIIVRERTEVVESKDTLALMTELWDVGEARGPSLGSADDGTWLDGLNRLAVRGKPLSKHKSWPVGAGDFPMSTG